MFQFAAIYAQAKRLNVPFFIEYGTVRMNKPRLEKYFNLPGYAYTRNTFRSWWWKNRLPRMTFVNEQSPEEVKTQEKNNVLVEGFFQSEQFFSEFRSDVLRLFTLRRKHTTTFTKKYASLFQSGKTLAVHWRRGDYLQEGFALPETYFRNSLGQIGDLSSYTVFFVSDDIAFMKQTFGEQPNFVFDVNDEITDFQILMNVDVAIISNSSFSWWAAYLNKKADKKIFGPKYWLGFNNGTELPVGVMTKGWTWMDVF
jgi:hypothetical protein